MSNFVIEVKCFEHKYNDAVREIFQRGLTSYGPPESDVFKVQSWFVNSRLQTDMANIYEYYKCSKQSEVLSSSETVGDSLYSFWIAVDAQTDEVVGCVGTIPTEDSKIIELQRMSVRQSHAKLGVGRKLVNKVEEFARSRNVEKITLSTLSVMDRALYFYRKCGFEESSRKEVDVSELGLELSSNFITIVNFVKSL